MSKKNYMSINGRQVEKTECNVLNYLIDTLDTICEQIDKENYFYVQLRNIRENIESLKKEYN